MINTGKPFALNEQGRRNNNEDSIYPLQNEADGTNRFFIVCDGMGGHEKGEVASRIVCDSFAAYLRDVPPCEFNETVFIQALNHAYNQLDRENDCPDPAKKMGTTLTFLYLNDKQAFMAHIGDSRIYHLRKNERGKTEIVYKSSDHSLVNELLKAAVITQEEAERHPKKNMITRVIQPNMEKRSKAEICITQDLQAGDRFFLCSDGVTESLTDAQLCDIAAGNDDEAMIKAIRTECEAYSHDNFSAWLVPVVDFIPPDEQSEIIPSCEQTETLPADKVNPEEKAEITFPPRRTKKKSKTKRLILLLFLLALLTLAAWFLCHGDGGIDITP